MGIRIYFDYYLLFYYSLLKNCLNLRINFVQRRRGVSETWIDMKAKKDRSMIAKNFKEIFFKKRNEFKWVENYLIKRDNCIKVSNGGARNNKSDVLKLSKNIRFSYGYN